MSIKKSNLFFCALVSGFFEMAPESFPPSPSSSEVSSPESEKSSKSEKWPWVTSAGRATLFGFGWIALILIGLKSEIPDASGKAGKSFAGRTLARSRLKGLESLRPWKIFGEMQQLWGDWKPDLRPAMLLLPGKQVVSYYERFLGS